MVGRRGRLYDRGYADLHQWLRLLGLSEWAMPASLAVLALLGLWTYLHRDRDLWLLLGVSGIVSRLWTYHLWHDEVVLVFAAVALFGSCGRARRRTETRSAPQSCWRCSWPA